MATVIGQPGSPEISCCSIPRRSRSSDREVVRDKILATAPDIDVRIVSNEAPDPAVYRWQVTRPCLVFSPFRLVAYRAPRGAVQAGRLIGKAAECFRLQECGLPVPRTARLLPGLHLDPAVWGEYVIVKPVTGLQGRGVRLLRTEAVAGQLSALTDNARRQMLIQQYIDHVDERGHPSAYRVLTMIGEPLYQIGTVWQQPRRPLAELAADPDGIIASNSEGTAKRRWPIVVPEVLALARRVAHAFPDIPCLGQDIIRETGTGALYVLETNPGGATWHLSSPLHRHHRGHSPEYFTALYAQFDALSIVADRLIARTRAQAA
jgi:hypothetical protein